MIYIPCQAEFNKILTSEAFSYEHKGRHHHLQPPNGKAHPIQTQQLRQIIRNNPNTLPHPLRVGSALSSDNIPSISNLISRCISSSEANHSASSIGNIVPQFNNLFRVSKIRREVLSTDPNLITTIRGSDAFILDYAQLQKDCPDFIQQCIIESDVMIITLQIPFMKKVLSIYEGDLIDASFEDNSLSDHLLEHKSFFNDENQFLGGGYMDLNDESEDGKDSGKDSGDGGENDIGNVNDSGNDS
jgi:hypothetical protein